MDLCGHRNDAARSVPSNELQCFGRIALGEDHGSWFGEECLLRGFRLPGFVVPAFVCEQIETRTGAQLFRMVVIDVNDVIPGVRCIEQRSDVVIEAGFFDVEVEEHRPLPGEREEGRQRRNPRVFARSALHFDERVLQQFETGKVFDGAVALEDPPEFFVVVETEHAVATAMDVDLAAVRPMVHRRGKSFERILRREIGRAAMDHHHDPRPAGRDVAMTGFANFGGFRRDITDVAGDRLRSAAGMQTGAKENPHEKSSRGAVRSGKGE